MLRGRSHEAKRASKKGPHPRLGCSLRGQLPRGREAMLDARAPALAQRETKVLASPFEGSGKGGDREGGPMPVNVILADDHNMVRRGFCRMLGKIPGIEVVGDVDTARCLPKMVSDLRPDVTLMDVAMPDLDGIVATRQILRAVPDTKIIALSALSDHKTVAGMLEAGARGYVLKSDDFEELTRAIGEVTQGRTYLSPVVRDMLAQHYAEKLIENKSFPDRLSDKEQQVLRRVAEGMSSTETGESLGMSRRTVENHRQRIMDKLGIHTVAGLTKYAIRQGYTEL